VNRTKINAKARKKIAEKAEELQLTRCELKLAGCMGNAHAPAHRHKRSWYKGRPDYLLWDIGQWVAACQSCHHKIEFDKELTAKMFMQLRGEE
jgi:hypothetical protein